MKHWDFYHIIEKLKELALSEQAKAVLDRLEPFMKEEQCISKMKETTAARKVLDTCGTPPLVSMNGMEEAPETGRNRSNADDWPVGDRI